MLKLSGNNRVSLYVQKPEGERFTIDQRAKQAPWVVAAAYDAVAELGSPKRGGKSNWKAWNAIHATLNEALVAEQLAPVTYSMFDGWARSILYGVAKRPSG